jgi:hypothetical protein
MLAAYAAPWPVALACSVARRQVYRGEIHHAAWPLQDAEAELETISVAAAAGIALPDEAPFAALCPQARCVNLAAAARRIERRRV